MSRSANKEPSSGPRRATARQQAIRRDLTRRALELPDEERVALFAALRDHLQTEPSKERLAQEAARRDEALEVLRTVADHLGLDAEGKRKLTMRAFDRAPRRVRKDWKASRIATAWLTWPNAKKALLGHRVPVSFKQRHQEARMSQRERVLKDQLDGFRNWLATDPAEKTRPAYDHWRAGENRKRGDDEPKFVKSATLINNFGLSWATQEAQRSESRRG